MNKEKYSGDYIKSLCTMIARGNILDINTLTKYLEYADLDTPVKILSMELDMLFGTNLEFLNPKYYNYMSTDSKEYNPVDLILYSCICNSTCYTYKKNLFKEIIKIESINFSNLHKTLDYIVSEGNLELFKLLTELNLDFNMAYSPLKNDENISILDNCLALAICRLTINGSDISRHYPKEIFSYLISLEDVDFTLLKITKIILKTLLNLDIAELENDYTIFEKAREVVEKYQ